MYGRVRGRILRSRFGVAFLVHVSRPLVYYSLHARIRSARIIQSSSLDTYILYFFFFPKFIFTQKIANKFQVIVQFLHLPRFQNHLSVTNPNPH